MSARYPLNKEVEIIVNLPNVQTKGEVVPAHIRSYLLPDARA